MNLVSIPQWCDCCTVTRYCDPLCFLQFQSHNGAIAARILRNGFSSSSGVSIPQWCDCCLQKTLLLQPLVQVSIPQWCDCCQTAQQDGNTFQKFQSHNGAIAAKAKFWGLRAKWDKMIEGLQSTFGCPKNLRGSTASDPLKLRHFWGKLPPRLYLAFKVLKRA